MEYKLSLRLCAMENCQNLGIKPVDFCKCMESKACVKIFFKCRIPVVTHPSAGEKSKQVPLQGSVPGSAGVGKALDVYPGA